MHFSYIIKLISLIQVIFPTNFFAYKFLTFDAQGFHLKEQNKINLPATLTHKYVRVDVDGNNKSDRPEWASARYHAYYSPNAAFELQLQWMVATGPILQDLVNEMFFST